EDLLKLGDGLGFDVEKEVYVAQGCRVDAVWRSRIANLGTISYAFEVHRRGSRDSAILNLQRIRRNQGIQKVVIVSNQLEIEQFRQIIATLDEDFRISVGYLNVLDLWKAIDHLDELKNILDELGLLSYTKL
ncbi:MAG: hypothetical protein NTW26_11195, partial [bacterium]|nr:hypothetical protein [bacterium]